jgi:hypothetical protein
MPALHSSDDAGAASGAALPLPRPVAQRWMTAQATRRKTHRRTRPASTSPSSSWRSSRAVRNGSSRSTGGCPTGAVAGASRPLRGGRAPSLASPCGPSSSADAPIAVPTHESEAAPRAVGAGLRGLEIGLPSVHMGAVVDDLGVSSLRLLTQIPRADALSRRAPRGCPVLESGIARREDESSPRSAPGLRGFP